MTRRAKPETAMSRPPSRTRAAAAAPAHCPPNDCGQQQAEALARLATVSEEALSHFLELKPHLEAVGEIVRKWLGFCAFVRKWFPRVGWWLLPIIATLLTKGSSEAVDALVQAATVALQAAADGG